MQVQIRRLPKPVIAMVAGYAVGGGHVLHMVCDLTIAAENAVFGQTGPKVESVDAGYGASIMDRLVILEPSTQFQYFFPPFFSSAVSENAWPYVQFEPQVGPKRAREMWFLARFYTAAEADKMGLVNVVVPVSCQHLYIYIGNFV